MLQTHARQRSYSMTATGILTVAERLVQTSGFTWFSYADISAELGITKASLHHHFPTKADLGLALIVRYTAMFLSALDAIDAGETDPVAKLERYAKLYEDVLRAERLCLCGMLAAEYSTLPAPIQDEIRSFFDANERWLARVIDEGRRAGLLHSRGTSLEAARTLLSSLEGAMLVARSYQDVPRFVSAARYSLDALTIAPRPQNATKTS